MIKKGILKGSNRKEESWQLAKKTLREPYSEILKNFKTKVEGREDFDPTSLLQFGLFMSKGIINILREAEKKLGKEGQKVVIDGLIKTGYEIGKQMIDPQKIPAELSDIELMSFLATIINTQAWTSIEDPVIENEDECSFDILWCPLEELYKPFDCRVQRYLVQGIIEFFRDEVFKITDFQIEFKSTIPSGANSCKFKIYRKQQGEKDKWEIYSEKLEEKALESHKNKI
ncbi:MAG: hypothetical protein P8Y70_08815 [Candidatus Lokiarchaeota archaeon]